jgi:hypothetical protein
LMGSLGWNICRFTFHDTLIPIKATPAPDISTDTTEQDLTIHKQTRK